MTAMLFFEVVMIALLAIKKSFAAILVSPHCIVHPCLSDLPINHITTSNDRSL